MTISLLLYSYFMSIVHVFQISFYYRAILWPSCHPVLFRAPCINYFHHLKILNLKLSTDLEAEPGDCFSTFNPVKLLFMCMCVSVLPVPSERDILKGRVHCFSMQVVMNKCFLLNPGKKFGADSSCRFREKCNNPTL